MVIDWQHHLQSKKNAERAKGIEQYGSNQMRLAQGFPMDVQLRDMDEAGMDRAVLTGVIYDLEGCRVLNDEIAEWVEEHPDRFIGFAHTMPMGGEAALDELDRAVKDLGFKGCMIRSTINSGTEEDSKNSILLDDPAVFPFYKKIVELDIPLFVHPAFFPLYPHALPDPLRRSLKALSNMSSGCGREFECMAAVVRLVDGGVLEKFPSLKVVVAHLGGGISAILARLWGTAGRVGEENRKAAEKSMKYFYEIYFDTAGNRADIDALKFALTKISPKRIMFGTDYPQELRDLREIKRNIQDIKSLDISDKDKQLILEGNAATLLRIK